MFIGSFCTLLPLRVLFCMLPLMFYLYVFLRKKSFVEQVGKLDLVLEVDVRRLKHSLTTFVTHNAKDTAFRNEREKDYHF